VPRLRESSLSASIATNSTHCGSGSPFRRSPRLEWRACLMRCGSISVSPVVAIAVYCSMPSLRPPNGCGKRSSASSSGASGPMRGLSATRAVSVRSRLVQPQPLLTSALSVVEWACCRLRKLAQRFLVTTMKLMSRAAHQIRAASNFNSDHQWRSFARKRGGPWLGVMKRHGTWKELDLPSGPSTDEPSGGPAIRSAKKKAYICGSF
jgi:hypothetical protein